MSASTLAWTALRGVCRGLVSSRTARRRCSAGCGGMGPGGGAANLMTLMGARASSRSSPLPELPSACHPCSPSSLRRDGRAPTFTRMSGAATAVVVGEPRRGRHPLLFPVAVLAAAGAGAGSASTGCCGVKRIKLSFTLSRFRQCSGSVFKFRLPRFYVFGVRGFVVRCSVAGLAKPAL
jgi:hypothetical protein